MTGHMKQLEKASDQSVCRLNDFFVNSIICLFGKVWLKLNLQTALGKRMCSDLHHFFNYFMLGQGHYLTDSHCVKSYSENIFSLLGPVRLIKNYFTSKCPLLLEEPIDMVTISMISCSLEKYVMLYVYFKNTQLISYGELNFLP